MKNIVKTTFLVMISAVCCNKNLSAQFDVKPLTVVIIRHAEKPKLGDNLNCQGLNRSQLLPAVIKSKFGVPDFTYVPALGLDSVTKHARMFETITPCAVKYNLTINSRFSGKDSSGLVSDIMKRNGTVLVVWDHKSILPILHSLGIHDPSYAWNDDDYDSIWIIRFKNGVAMLQQDNENLHPAADCN